MNALKCMFRPLITEAVEKLSALNHLELAYSNIWWY
jgi:hypothetical protein